MEFFAGIFSNPLGTVHQELRFTGKSPLKIKNTLTLMSYDRSYESPIAVLIPPITVIEISLTIQPERFKTKNKSKSTCEC